MRCAKRLLAAVLLAGIRLFAGMCPSVGLQVMRGGEGFAAVIFRTFVGPLLGVRAHMLLQVAQRGEALLAQLTVERLAIVQTKVGVQSVCESGDVDYRLIGPGPQPLVYSGGYQSSEVEDDYSPVARVERLIAAGHLAFVWLHLRVDSDVDLQAVGSEECLVASIFRAFKAVVAWKAEKTLLLSVAVTRLNILIFRFNKAFLYFIIKRTKLVLKKIRSRDNQTIE